MRQTTVSVIATLALLAASTASGAMSPAAASGAPRPSSLLTSPLLWATVDVCRSSPSGDVVGLRGSMPGTGNRSEQMYMIFRLQVRGPHGSWTYLPGPTAPPVGAGSSQFRSRQAGLDFRLAAGAAAESVVRGVVKFEWLRAGKTEHETKLETTGGHPASAGASPHGLSLAHCTLS